MKANTTLYTSPSGVMAITRTPRTVAIELHTASETKPLGVVHMQGYEFDKLAMGMAQFVKPFGVPPETYEPGSPLLRQNLGRAINKSLALRRKVGEERSMWNQ